MLYRIGGTLLALVVVAYVITVGVVANINQSKYHDSCDKACIARSYPEGVVQTHLDFDATCLCQGLLTLDDTGAWK